MHAMIIVIYVKCLYYLGIHICNKQKKYRISHLCRVHWPRHTANGPSFAVCNDLGTRQRLSLCRVPGPGSTQQTSLAMSAWQPAKNISRGSARAHGKSFDVCPLYCTRQRVPLPMAICRVPFAVCGTPHTANHLPWAFWPLSCAIGTRQKGCLP